MKCKQIKISTVESNKRDLKQIIPLEKLKYRNLALERSIQDNTNLVLVSNLSPNLNNC